MSKLPTHIFQSDFTDIQMSMSMSKFQKCQFRDSKFPNFGYRKSKYERWHCKVARNTTSIVPVVYILLNSSLAWAILYCCKLYLLHVRSGCHMKHYMLFCMSQSIFIDLLEVSLLLLVFYCHIGPLDIYLCCYSHCLVLALHECISALEDIISLKVHHLGDKFCLHYKL